jgi:hypothetical protein
MHRHSVGDCWCDICGDPNVRDVVVAAETIRVTGYRETARALGKVNKEAKATLFAGLRAAAAPIAADAQQRLAGYRGMSTSTIKPSAQIRGVFVVQRAKKKTGTRPDFGALQMREGLIPALDAGAGDIETRVEAAFTALIAYNGFGGI